MDLSGALIEPVGAPLGLDGLRAVGDPPSIPRCEGEHSLQIPGHGHEAPLATHVFEPATGKLTESEHGFDDAGHRFRSLSAQGVERSALWRLQCH